MVDKSESNSRSATPVSDHSFDLVTSDRPFDNILNFRDVGSFINSVHGSKCDRPSFIVLSWQVRFVDPGKLIVAMFLPCVQRLIHMD
jgi:hypothetical protein